MRKPICVSQSPAPANLSFYIGSGVQAFLFGSVAKGTATESSDLDIYLTGPCAEKVESRYMFERPLVKFNGQVYPLHIIGPLTTATDVFFASQPEARRVM